MTEPIPARGGNRFLTALGIDRRPEDGKVRFATRFFVIVGVLAAVVVLNGLVHYSESPTFCHSCHIMEPYYQAWKASKHHNVPCVQCHYAPSPAKVHLWHKFQALSQVAKYVTRTYSSKPYAEVEDAACMRPGCHSTRLLEGKLVTKQGINFDHRPHLTERRRGRKLQCVSCHSQVMVGKHIEVTYDTCILCHFRGRGEGRDIKPIGGCTGCHNLPTRSFKLGNMTYNHRDFVTKRGVSCMDCHSDVLSGSGNVEQDRCFTCHNQPEKIAKFNDIQFIHDNHVTKHHVACFHCHEPMRHGSGQGISSAVEPLGKPGAKPGAKLTAAVPADTVQIPGSHAPTLVFECSNCHENKHVGTREMYTGNATALGLPDMPSPMYRANVDCIGCHYQGQSGPDGQFKGRNWRASQQACVKCHGSKFDGVFQDARTLFRQALALLDKKMGATRAALDKSAAGEDQRAGLEHRLAQAERWVRFVRDSRGEHNVYLASLALRRADTEFTQVGEALKAPLPDASASPLISGSYCATLCHARAGVKVPPVTVKAFGKTMPHKMHAEQMGCVKCHEIGAHKSVPLKRGIKAVCAECHSDK